MKRALALILGLVSAHFAFADEANPLQAFKRIKNLALPVGPDAAKPALRINCASIEVGRKSLGFLQVGFWPEVLAKDVVISLSPSSFNGEWAKQLALFLRANPTMGTARIKGLIIVAGENLAPLLVAHSARFGLGPARIELEEFAIGASNELVFDRRSAVMPLEGERAGSIFLRESGHQDRIIELPMPKRLPLHDRQSPPINSSSP